MCIRVCVCVCVCVHVLARSHAGPPGQQKIVNDPQHSISRPQVFLFLVAAHMCQYSVALTFNAETCAAHMQWGLWPVAF